VQSITNSPFGGSGYWLYRGGHRLMRQKEFLTIFVDQKGEQMVNLEIRSRAEKW
jgi:hypothetical protein